MNRSISARILIVLLLLVTIFLLALSVVAVTQNARIRAALEEMRREKEATDSFTSTTPRDPVKTNGYVSLKDGKIGTMCLYYYGDDTFYGRGSGTAPDTSAEGASATLLHRALCGAYEIRGNNRGRILEYRENLYTTEEVARDFLLYRLVAAIDYRLTILCPSDAILSQNEAKLNENGYNGILTGDSGKDVEALVRSIRESMPYGDVLLAVPHNASDTLAEVITAIGAHYDLLTVDLRGIAAVDGMVHTSGDDAGYPTAEGHRAIADAIAAAIAEAVESGRQTTGIPQAKLYQ